MIFHRSITLGCLSFLLVNFTYICSSQAQNARNFELFAQSLTNNNSTVESKAKKIVDDFFRKQFESLADVVVADYPDNFTSAKMEDDYRKRHQAKMEEAYQKIQQDNGKFTEIKQSKVLNTPTNSLVTLTLEFEKVTEDWIFIFNKNQKLIGVSSPISEDIQTIADNFLKAIVEEDYSKARSYLHPFLKETISSGQIETGWNSLTNKNGKFKDIIDTNIKRGSVLDTTDLVFMDLEFAKGTQKILIIFDSSKNITGVDFITQ